MTIGQNTKFFARPSQMSEKRNVKAYKSGPQEFARFFKGKPSQRFY